MARDPALLAAKPEAYWPMLQTAEMVAKRYAIPRERQDRFGAESQQRPARRQCGQALRPRSPRSPSPWA